MVLHRDARRDAHVQRLVAPPAALPEPAQHQRQDQHQHQHQRQRQDRQHQGWVGVGAAAGQGSGASLRRVLRPRVRHVLLVQNQPPHDAERAARRRAPARKQLVDVHDLAAL